MRQVVVPETRDKMVNLKPKVFRRLLRTKRHKSKIRIEDNTNANKGARHQEMSISSTDFQPI